LLRKIIAVVILLPLAIVMIAFAVANRQIVRVSLDPFGGSDSGLALPLFVLIILLLIIGVLIGGLAAWVRQGKWRSAARRAERQLEALRKKLEAYEGTVSGPTIIPDAGDPSPQRLQLKPPLR
jgi:uncharacterized integral membrane protein